MKKYLIRLDDACPTMNSAKWQRMEDILDSYGIQPMVGVIPDNQDPKQMIDQEDPNFWLKVISWSRKKWSIAIHGYNHCYISDDGLKGLNPLWARSEFAGVPLDVQKEKIRDGVKIMHSHGLDPKYFFAPSHTYDQNTLVALKEESNIRVISDTIATRPYKMGDFIFIPQVGGHCIDVKISGIWTFCLHPSTMTEEEFARVELFFKKHEADFLSFDNLDLSCLKKKDFFSCTLSWMYFLRRRCRNS